MYMATGGQDPNTWNAILVEGTASMVSRIIGPGDGKDSNYRLLREDLENRVLDFDSAAAAEAASLAAAQQKSGRSVDMRDTQIAGIALVRHAALATRNVRHFADQISIVDPWVSA
jgi:predicted nucleic acid-binding protein